MFEALTLIQTGKIEHFPVVLMGSDYWHPVATLLEQMAQEGTISPRDRELVLITDSVEAMCDHLERYAVKRFQLQRQVTLRPIGMLGERV